MTDSPSVRTNICKIISQLITKHMQDNNLSYRQLAAKFDDGISPQTASNWTKTGKVDPKYLRVLFKVISVSPDLRRAIMADRLGMDSETLDHAVGLSSGVTMPETNTSKSPVSPAAALLHLLSLTSAHSIAVQRKDVDEINSKTAAILAELREKHGPRLKEEEEEVRHIIGKITGKDPTNPRQNDEESSLKSPWYMISASVVPKSASKRSIKVDTHCAKELPGAKETRNELDDFISSSTLWWNFFPVIRYVWVVNGLAVGAGKTAEEARSNAELALDMTDVEDTPETMPGSSVMILALSDGVPGEGAWIVSDLMDNLHGLSLSMPGTEFRSRAWEHYFEKTRSPKKDSSDLLYWPEKSQISPEALHDLSVFNLWVGDSANWRRDNSDNHDLEAYTRFVPGGNRNVFKVMCTIDATKSDTVQYKHLSIQQIDPDGQLDDGDRVPLLSAQVAIADCFAITPRQVEECSRMLKRSTGWAVSIMVPLLGEKNNDS
jgi:hypothetical protein